MLGVAIWLISYNSRYWSLYVFSWLIFFNHYANNMEILAFLLHMVVQLRAKGDVLVQPASCVSATSSFVFGSHFPLLYLYPFILFSLLEDWASNF
ncbi:hypothetical protein RJT34_22505 [Clitoria ternatea]|uniref:Uncharacterized protein n=1 Tax=Clitoria ternatea TaxID=43366 RepID=A0AAN9IFM7_CLITE